MPMKSPIRNAVIAFDEMTTSVLAIVTDVIRDGRQVVGYGFNSNGRYAQSGLLRDRLLPRLFAATPHSILNDDGSNFDPHRVWNVVMTNEKPGGHGDRSVAVGVIDMAVWDIVGKIARKPLHQVLAEQFGDGAPDKRVSVCAAGGYYQEKGIDSLREEIKRYIDAGYKSVKIKIGGVPLIDDLRRIDAVLEIVGSGDRLAVDANGRLDLQRAIEYADALAPYNLRWFEEPVDPLDFALLAQLGQYYRAPLATGENLFSMQDVRNLIRYGGMRVDRDFVQMDPTLSYGLVEYLRMMDVLRSAGWSGRQVMPHGGQQLALNLVAGLKLGGFEAYPGMFEPFGGLAETMAVNDGYINLSDEVGIGFEANPRLFKLLDRVATA